MVRKSLLSKIPTDVVKTIHLYRLGVFGKSSFELVELASGENYPMHRHKKSKAVFHMIIGQGKIILSGKAHPYKPGDTFNIPKGMWHGFASKSETLFLSIQTPPIKDPKTGIEDIE